MFAGDYALEGWEICDGRSLQVRENAALFSVISNRYGGDGIRTFHLPDMRERLPMQPKSMRDVGTVQEHRGGAGSVAESGTSAAGRMCPSTLAINFIICVSGGDYPVKSEM